MPAKFPEVSSRFTKRLFSGDSSFVVTGVKLLPEAQEPSKTFQPYEDRLGGDILYVRGKENRSFPRKAMVI